MAAIRTALISATASLPLVAWEAPTQNELAALMGMEPQATLLACGLEQPPSAAEAKKQAGYRYEIERMLIKQVLVYRTSLAKSNRGRISTEIEKNSAEMGRRLGAPAVFCRYLELQAGNSLNLREQYALRQALKQLVRGTYGIDELQIRLLSETLSLPAPQHMQFMLNLPVSGMFDMVPRELPPKSRILSDMQVMTAVLRTADSILRTVSDTETADAAAERLQQLLPIWNTTRQLRFHTEQLNDQLEPAERMAVRLLESTTRRLVQTRRALLNQGWYNSTRLPAIDELLR